MNQFLRTVDISKSIFDVVYEGAKDTFPDLSTLNISNVLSGANTSVVETGVNPVMYIPPQNMQPVNEQVVAYDAYGSSGSSGGGSTTTEELINSIDNILESNNQSIEVRVNLLYTLANMILNGDIILKNRLSTSQKRNLMKYVEAVEHKSYEEQKAIASFVCNLSRVTNDMESRLWLFCHIREVAIVAKYCLLQPTSLFLKDIGTSIFYNLASKVGNELISEIVIDLTSTLITFLSKRPTEEHLFRSLTAISIFVTVSEDTVVLMNIFGQDYLSFRGTSSRCDQLIDQIKRTL